ncbi:SRPBCC family protein [Streptosporangium sp. NBC_01756]|uniref:SRPBCC family protein n=1 Tax=Streptosporangium sp. NBC_01756 TaxID=2975950 RepID=UPI002DDAC27A|nr:SRPBCC family protein [Streptosporangium sp. NBC_01756]WSC89821.1 SRPBCC family protein [Streptosporangium sp. NBC_01756]
MSPPSASVSIHVSAPPAVVYALVTDITGMGAWNVECLRAEWVGQVREARPGARFRGHNSRGRRRWSTICTVTAADPGRVFAYHVRAAGLLDVALWRFGITPTKTGCHLEQGTWDTRGPFMRVVGGLVTGVRDRAAHNEANMRRTLEGIKRVAERI